MLQVRETTPEDIKSTNKWMLAWNKNEREEHLYPTKGLILEDTDTGEGIWAGYVWITNSAIAYIGFVTRNPNYSKNKIAKQNKENFLRELISYANKLGYSYITTWTEDPFLISDYKKIGFTETSDKTSEFILKII